MRPGAMPQSPYSVLSKGQRMPSALNKPSRKILSNISVEVSCSQFAKIFLAREASMLKQSLNAHLNHILKLYLNGRLPKIRDSVLSIESLEAALLNHDGAIKINLYRTLYALLLDKQCDLEGYAEQAIKNHIIGCLGDANAESTHIRIMAAEILQHLAENQF